MIIDIYSRYVPGWMLAKRESASLAEWLLPDSICKQQIDPGQLVIHSDRGSSMASKPVALLLADLGRDQQPLPAPLLERQPLLRGAVQDPHVPTRVPRSLRLHRGRSLG